MSTENLSEELNKKIEQLVAEGNVLVDEDDYVSALDKFEDALDLIPNPKSSWDEALWIYASIGDMQVFTEDYESAAENFFNALNCPDAQQNSFLHLRLGQALFELDDKEKALDHLLKAYEIDGEEIFDDEDHKYYDYLKANM
ncbi:tetratricopeptide repeat protein [Pedobacter sp. MR2016-24]|uniref:tetratricopeptide repeat protein n=1 Tax=Pedobacter sp. MR2016-24 TaxID=2994466 RepID=UPI00224762FA|nr:tetratricopeptide repeat protein [Pedobacter sp. MR2016-24]MCX2485937.1 tetratricopeptide repeat protein [Pedobacter sp. MR2016-24]